MGQPEFSVEITASLVAWYAAIVSTVGAIIHVSNYLRDRKRVRVSYQENMRIFNDPRRAGVVFVLIKVINVGRRPFTLTNIGMKQLKEDMGAIFLDTVPQIPCELTEGKEALAFVDQSTLDFEDIKAFEAYDTTGRTFRAYVASWPRRFYWALRR